MIDEEYILRWMRDIDNSMQENFISYIKDRQEIWGHIHILEEQQEIMHNFLVEINKYLDKMIDKKEPGDTSWANTNQLGK